MSLQLPLKGDNDGVGLRGTGRQPGQTAEGALQGNVRSVQVHPQAQGQTLTNEVYTLRLPFPIRKEGHLRDARQRFDQPNEGEWSTASKAFAIRLESL